MPMIRGPVAWAKLGKPQPGYNKNELEWSFELGLDKKTAAKFRELGVGEYIKPAVNPKSGKEHVLGTDYVKFSRKAKKADGTDAQPIRIVDAKGEDWPTGKRIGNGSILNVKFALNEKKSGGLKPGVLAVQVWELVEFEGEDDFPVREDGSEDWSDED